MADATYRNAGEDDISLILEFIKKLADYEGRLDEVTATEEDLSRWIFQLILQKSTSTLKTCL